MRARLGANELIKHNIDAMLRERKQTRAGLSRYCRRSRSWLDKIFSESRREVPAKYFDRIADFFGIATYQLFQPGLTATTERRSAVERRTGRDRRISRAFPLSQKPGDVDLMDVIRALSRDGREQAIVILGDILNDELQRLRTTRPADDQPHRTPENRAPTSARPKKKIPKTSGEGHEA